MSVQLSAVEGNTLHFDRFLQMDYSVTNEGQVFNTFPLIAGFDVSRRPC